MRFTRMPDSQIAEMRQSSLWPQVEAIAPTLDYDHAAILGETAGVPVDLAAQVTVPTLVMSGGASLPFMQETAETQSNVIPNAHVLACIPRRGDIRGVATRDHRERSRMPSLRRGCESPICALVSVVAGISRLVLAPCRFRVVPLV
jgi:hypothetical protein